MKYQIIKCLRSLAALFFVVGCLFLLSGLGIGWGNTELPKETVLSLELALKAANAALGKCDEGGYRVSVAVVDRGGNLKALLRGDGAGPHTQDSSARKAYTASSIRRSTQELAELRTKVPNLQALGDMNERILILGGGLPLVLGNEVVGGIGVGGAP
ncbi:MAG: heme-binding protein, partial [Nitrospirales bacterium]